MRLEEKKNHVVKIGEFEEANFEIDENSPVAFQVLHSNLYSDPMLAIVRELSTNAWDAHVEKGTSEKPFLVHLPNRLEPYFYIRDYGTGLPHEDVMHLYTTYFKSTKTDTNKQVGCWGLGSKSPFAYTDSFVVTSWFDGKRRIYNLFKGPKGTPRIALESTADDDSPSGLEVRFACKSQDTAAFLERAAKVYARFPILPNFIGSSKFDPGTRVPWKKGPGWIAYKPSMKRWDSEKPTSYAIMGCIGYPIHPKQLGIDRDAMALLGSVPIDLTFPIGSLEIAASREELQYSKKTIRELTKQIDSVARQIAAEIQEDFVNCKSLWQAAQLWNRLFNGNSVLNRVSDSIGKRILWQGQRVSTHASQRGYRVAWPSGFSEEDVTFFHYRLAANTNGDDRIYRDNDVYPPNPDGNVILMIDDMDTLSGEKIRSWMKCNQHRVVYVVTLTKWTKANEDGLHELLGTKPFDYIRTSSLPKPIRKAPVRNGNAGKSTLPIYSRGLKFKKDGDHYADRERRSWNESEVDISTPGVYVSWMAGFAEDRRGGRWRTVAPRTLVDIMDYLEILGKPVGTLYGIKSGYVKKAEEKGNKKTDLFVYVEDVLKEFLSDAKNRGLVAELDAMRNKLDDIDNIREIGNLVGSGQLHELACRFNHALAADKAEAALYLANLIGFEIKSNRQLIDLHDKTMQRYKLVDLVLDFHRYFPLSNNMKIELAKYARLIDKEEG